MNNNEKNIELYPGHWLYNASIIGFISSLKNIEEIEIDEYFNKDGRLIISKKIFRGIRTEQRYFSDEKISSIVAKAPIYRNYLQSNEKELFCLFVKSLEELESYGKCDFSSEAYNLPIETIKRLKSNGLEQFLNRIMDFNMIFHANLGPSLGMFPNAYWNFNQSNKICHLSAYLIIHQHLAFNQVAGQTKVFINAPSFQLMYELNKLIESLVDKENASYKNLLAMSIIEFSIKTNVMLNTWASMNIEIIAIQKDGIIEFISLPYETVKLLSNKRVAELLSSIGEFKILNMVIDGRNNELIELGYRVLKIALKPSMGKEDRNFIDNSFFKYENRDIRNLNSLANKLFKLYALIQENTN